VPDLEKLQKLWQIATDQIKKRITNIAVWRAMESAIVLDYEGGTLVLGLPGESYSQSGHLLVPEHRNLIEEVLTQITQRSLTFRVVECGSVEEWKTYKVAEERKRAAQMALINGQRPRAAVDQKSGEQSPVPDAAVDAQSAAIENVNDILNRAYKIFSALPHRTMSQSRARFVRDAAQMLAGAEGQLVASGMDTDTVMRTIDRAIDRIAVWGECDATTVALEYLRHKERA
jgi:hypothetical protein